MGLRPAWAMTASGLVKRSLALSGHRTSVALEPEFWDALDAIAAARGQTLITLVAAEDAARDPGRSVASALRVLALGAANHTVNSTQG